MLVSSIPTKFPIAFANSAAVGFITTPIPTASLAPLGRASLTDGFPQSTFEAIAAGGNPPWGADMNGILFEITSWNRWQSAGGPVFYDSSFSSSIGGYPKGALLQKAATFDRFWLSSVDNNTSDPDTGGANWIAFPDLITQQQAANYTATDSGIQNHPSIALPLATPIASLIGAPIRFRIAFANTITNPDIVINGSAAVPMFNSDGSAIVAGQFPSAGTLVEGKLVATNDFRVTSPGKPNSTPAATFFPGMIFLWGAEVPPAGTFECNGQTVLISAAPNLFAVIGNRFGGDGTTNFKVPDCRGMFVRGWDHGRGLDPNAGTRTNSGNGTTGDHVGTIEQSSVKASDLGAGANAVIKIVPDDPVPGPGGSSGSVLRVAPHTGENVDAQAMFNAGDNNGIILSGQSGFSGTGWTPLNCSIEGLFSFPNAGQETRPININLMYVIAY